MRLNRLRPLHSASAQAEDLGAFLARSTCLTGSTYFYGNLAVQLLALHSIRDVRMSPQLTSDSGNIIE